MTTGRFAVRFTGDPLPETPYPQSAPARTQRRAGPVRRPRWAMPEDGPVIEALLDRAGLDRLRDALTAADFTADGIAALLGPDLSAALRAGEYGLVRRRLPASGPLATLVRLFPCRGVEPESAVAAALAPLPLADALAAGLLRPAPGGLAAALDLHPYGEDGGTGADHGGAGAGGDER